MKAVYKTLGYHKTSQSTPNRPPQKDTKQKWNVSEKITGIPWQSTGLGIHAFVAAGPSPITGQGTNSPQATWCSQKKKERERESERKEIKAENYPSLKRETYPGTGRTESPKQDESKQIYIKTYN